MRFSNNLFFLHFVLGNSWAMFSFTMFFAWSSCVEFVLVDGTRFSPNQNKLNLISLWIIIAGGCDSVVSASLFFMLSYQSFFLFISTINHGWICYLFIKYLKFCLGWNRGKFTIVELKPTISGLLCTEVGQYPLLNKSLTKPVKKSFFLH